MKVIGLSGANGSGKDTVAQHLIDAYGFKKFAFAKTVKDIAAIAFGWNRDLLEGSTPESRIWREQIDPVWDITPRSALQKIGTDMFRAKIRDDFWLKKTQLEIQNADCPIVITDCRFEHEFEFIKSMGGQVFYVQRTSAESHIPDHIKVCAKNYKDDNVRMEIDKVGINISEWAMFSFIGKVDEVIDNNGSLEQLFENINKLLVK
jgi:hypothetical protein